MRWARGRGVAGARADVKGAALGFVRGFAATTDAVHNHGPDRSGLSLARARS